MPTPNPDDNQHKPDPSRYRLPRQGKRTHAPAESEPAIRTPSIPSPSSLLSNGLKVCQDCAGICLQTVNDCLDLGGQHASARHQAVLQDCADICETTARFIARRSPHFAHLCRECAEICSICARECDAIPNSEVCMIECAQACRRCAETCLGMTVHEGEG